MNATVPLWPFGLYVAIVIVIIAGMLAVSWLLGQRHSEHATGSPYESGIISEGTARVRFSARFYLTAVFFVVFDLEAAFLFAWAIAARDSGWTGYWEVVAFVGILVIALAYLWRAGALDWAPGAAGRNQ